METNEIKVGSPEFFAKVRKEIESIKQNATKEEIERLDADKLVPREAEFCIYGLMTGNCYSDRASELFFAAGIERELFQISDFNRPAHFTVLEVSIINYPHLNPSIISYLKGETDTLELTANP